MKATMNMVPSHKAVIYARVSTREQADQGYSIEAQGKLLKDYARNHDLEVVREFTDIESAKGTGRPQFGEMLHYLRTTPSVRTVLCEKTDRLYRNFHDYIELDVDKSNLTVILVKENAVLNRESRSHEKLVHGFKVLLAKNYIDNLKEETAKGMLEKAEQGEFPNFAPMGYKNNRETHRIEVDPNLAPFVRKAFELYSTGQFSVQTLTHKLIEDGMRSKGGRKIGKAEIFFMLNNPIYYGDFRWRKRLFKGIHEPLIAKELFDAAQRTMKRGLKRPIITRREFAFRGLLVCGRCGCSFTAEQKKGQYTYYHCTFAKGRCSNRYMREEDVDKALGEALKAVQMDRALLDYFTDGLRQSHSQEKAFHNEAIAALQQTYNRLQEKLDKMYADKLDGTITAEFWEKQSAAWRKEQEEARSAMARHESANQGYFDMGVALLEAAAQAYDIYRVRSLPEKRALASFVLSNLSITREKVVPIYKEPFAMLAEGLPRLNELPD